MGAAFVILVGALTVQVIGLQAGAVFDLSNTVVAVTEPRHPVWPSVAIAVLGVLVMVALVAGGRRGGRPALVGGFVVATAALVVWGFALMVDRDSGGEQTVGVLAGWAGWVEKGGLSPAVHVVLLLALASLWLGARRPADPARRQAATSGLSSSSSSSAA